MARDIPCRVMDWAEWSPLPRVSELNFKVRVGDLVTLRSRGAVRLARVTKVGRERLYTEYTTESALHDAARWGTQPTVTRKPVNIYDDPACRFVSKKES